MANTSAALWQSVAVAATGETTVIGNVFVPQTPGLYDDPATPAVNEGYDADGNQLRDGRWTYEWDAENRLVKIVKRFPATDLATVPHPTTGVPTVFDVVTDCLGLVWA